MKSYDPESLIQEKETEQDNISGLSVEALEWFLDDENVGEMYPRDQLADKLKYYLKVDEATAQKVITSLVGDIVDPVQQINTELGKYVGAIEYKEYPESGAYGYMDFDDTRGKRKRAVCSRCVEIFDHDNQITNATEGDGTSPHGATWDQLIEKIEQHYENAHRQDPSDIEVGASLLSGTTISGQPAWHDGNVTVGPNMSLTDRQISITGGVIELYQSEGDLPADESPGTLAYVDTPEGLQLYEFV